MQSSSSPGPVSQHISTQPSSPQRTSAPSHAQSSTPQETPQQHIPTTSRDITPVESNKPTTPPGSQPSSQSSPHPQPSSRPAPAPLTGFSGSTLSATAPHFRTRLIDAPIDLAGLEQPTDGGPPLLQQATMGSGGSSSLDFSSGFASFNDGRTPTQESFPPIRTPSFPEPSPSLASNAFSPELSPKSSTSSLGDSSQGSLDNGLRTPNVYINGLPPNFPEESLLAMTSPFGEVISVRTFTRHVSEKPSGYGFVLFGTVEAAAKCIDSLRKYRNLHPSFSKQIHKIPGTAYANSVALPASATEPPDSFKARMERLKDQSSTNLYMEGLPLSIDPQTLQALVQPFKIMSSRLFQTRLSNPPRIIAFVRLESRQAAEQVIERLHGRMVRGWKDSGSRISVRFADTAEQRELRRNERMGREGENSPARLTMAQAALLNLQGTQLAPGSQASRLPSPNFSASPPMLNDLALTSPVLPPPIGYHNQQALDEYPGLTGRATHAYRDHDLNAQAADFVSPGLRFPSHMFGADDDLSNEALPMHMAVGGGLVGGGATYARSGYTDLERLILQVHEQKQREVEKLAQLQQQVFAGSDFNGAAADFRSDAGMGGLQSNASRETGRRLVNVMPTMSEEDFHATGGGRSGVSPSLSAGSSFSSPQPDQGVSRLAMDLDSRLNFTRQRNQTHAEARAQAQADTQAQTHHIRSTTVPSQYFASDRQNMSTFPASRTLDSVNAPAMTTGQATRPSLHDRDMTVRHIPQVRGTYLNSMLQRDPNGPASLTRATRDLSSSIHSSAPPLYNTKARTAVAAQQPLQTRIDTSLQARKALALARSAEEEDEEGLDSPALSYSASVRTPASLSPATPFSAFGETFEGPPGGCDGGLAVAVGAGKGKGRAVEGV